ncbi:MAG: ester cyclase [Actinobacteria bacterium]|nr:MAG: ester cyclase [Actinomycetota bacterium]
MQLTRRRTTDYAHVVARLQRRTGRTSFEAFNANDIDSCLAVLAPDFVMHLAELPEPLRGRDTWREGVELMKAAFPDLHAHIEDIIAAEDRVAARLTLSGTHTGEYLGFPPTGRAVKYVSREFYRVADGLIAEEWICSDTASLFQQLS